MRIGSGSKVAALVLGGALAVAGSTYALRIPRPVIPEVSVVAGSVGAPTTDQAGGSPAQQRTSEQEVERLIHAYEDRVATNPDPLEFTLLGQLYLQRARTTGDVASYEQAETALERALGMYPTDPEAGTLLATAHFSMHDFAGALTIAQDIYDRDPTQLPALAVVADAEQELGDYDAATRTYEQLATEVPHAPGVEARLARSAFLHGSSDRAASLAAQAFADASDQGSFGSELAWYRTLQGQIALDSGDYDQGLRFYRDAVRIAPDYHVGRAGLARALAATGALRGAIANYRKAIDLVPQPTYLAALGDLYVATSQPAKAAGPYATVRAIATLGAVGRQVYDRQLALFDADHDRRIAEAIRIASASLERRHDIYGYDTYAWALYRAGRYAEARDAMDQASALGAQDARLFFHAGMISTALGDERRAIRELTQALTISPEFDPLLAPVARRTLASFGEGP
jgi:tetratricopeptide (TPR) repeat protein